MLLKAHYRLLASNRNSALTYDERALRKFT